MFCAPLFFVVPFFSFYHEMGFFGEFFGFLGL